MTGSERGLRVAVFGPTGLAGAGVVRAWLNDPRVKRVRAVTRSPLATSSPILEEVLCRDFLDLDPIADHLQGLDAVCFCLGVSAAQVRDSAEYRRITHDFALVCGRAVKVASPSAIFHYISGSGTSARSLMNWARVKAETERDLSGIGLGGCVAWRPAMILADPMLDPVPRMQRAVGSLARGLRFLPGLSVDNTEIGRAMLQATLEGRLEGVIENREIRSLAERCASSE